MIWYLKCGGSSNFHRIIDKIHKSLIQHDE